MAPQAKVAAVCWPLPKVCSRLSHLGLSAPVKASFKFQPITRVTKISHATDSCEFLNNHVALPDLPCTMSMRVRACGRVMNILQRGFSITVGTVVAVLGPFATGLPLKAEAIQCVKLCSLYGAGFSYIP